MCKATVLSQENMASEHVPFQSQGPQELLLQIEARGPSAVAFTCVLCLQHVQSQSQAFLFLPTLERSSQASEMPAAVAAGLEVET